MNVEPLPLEKELRIESIKRHISELPREELVDNLASAIDTLTRMTHQTKQLVAYIEIMEDLGRFDTTGALHRISCPTLLVAGEADHSSVAGSAPLESARMLHAGIAGSKLVTIPGAFHYPHIDHAPEFNAAAMQFLQTHAV